MASAVLNRDCFEPPKESHYAGAARGAAVPAFDGNTPDAWLKASRNGGMTRMNRVHLAVGQYYYRFCDSARFQADWKRQASGPWWIEYETFDTVRSFARQHAHIRAYGEKTGQSGLSYAMKLHAAVPYEWGDGGALVVARLKARVDAWKGWGATAELSADATSQNSHDGGAKYIPLQNPGVFQLYIPEIWRHFDDAFEVVDKGPARNFA